MDNQLTNAYIINAIKSLIDDLGVKESVNHDEIIKLIYRQQIKDAIYVIARQLGLPIKINISYVSKNYKSNDNNKFRSKAMSRVNRERSEEIIAQVAIPKDLPMFGSHELINYKIDVKVSENCCTYPETFIAVIAHELSHVLLYSLRHPEKENEIYTDLVANILGFSDVISIGRKNEVEEDLGYRINTLTTTYGYLTDEQFELVNCKIKEIIEKYKTIINQCVNQENKMEMLILHEYSGLL